MRKILSLLLIVVLLSACGGSQEPKEKGAGTSDQAVVGTTDVSRTVESTDSEDSRPEIEAENNDALPETLDLDFCADYAEAHMPEGITATFSTIDEGDVQVAVGRFRNDTGKDVSLDLECSYGDENGVFWGNGVSSQPLLREGDEYIEVFDIGEEYQSYMVDCYISDVPDGVYLHYEATSVEDRKNADGSIGYKVTSSDPEGYTLLIKAFFFNEKDEIVGCSSADIGGSGDWDWDQMEIPSVEYDSYKVIWSYNNI